jgi:hypothetical protein
MTSTTIPGPRGSVTRLRPGRLLAPGNRPRAWRAGRICGSLQNKPSELVFEEVDMPEAVAQLDRDQAIWSEWVEGSSMEQIGQRRGLTHQAVSAAVRRYVESIPEPERAAYRAKLLVRYEELYQAHRATALERPRVAAIVRGILDSQVRLLGLEPKSTTTTPLSTSLALPSKNCWSGGGPRARSGPGPRPS